MVQESGQHPDGAGLDAANRAVLVCSSSDGVNWTSNTATGQYSGIAPSLAAPPTPLIFRTVVDSGAMLNVGDANLTYLAYDMLFNPAVTANGADNASYTEQGSWGSINPPECENTVTVTASITAGLNSGSNSVGSWTWQDLRGAFAAAAGAVMQTVSMAYQNYSYTLAFTGTEGGDICVDPQPSDSGYYIPAQIMITAYNNAPESTGQQAEVTLTYSTGDQSGGSPCDAINALDGVLAIFPEASEFAAIVGAATGIVCEIIGSS